MLKITDIEKNCPDEKRSETKRGVGLGVFDGFHAGHRELVKTLISECTQRKIPSCVYTFKDHPSFKSRNRERISNGLLSSNEERFGRLSGSGLDEIFVREFDSEFAGMSPVDFLKKHLQTKLNASLIVVGYNYRFGKNREGDVDLLKQWAEQAGIDVIVIDPVMYKGESVSSSRIRMAIKRGDIKESNAMLSGKYTLRGKVSSGQRLGKKLGFPTANITPGKNLCLPKNGVYITKLHSGGLAYESVTNIGVRPSVCDKHREIVVETVVLDMELDLYDKEIVVEFIDFIRSEKKFDDIEELKKQVFSDIEKARIQHARTEDFSLLAKEGNICIYSVKSERFSTNVLHINFYAPLSAKLASTNYLLAAILTSTCKKYPTRKELGEYLDSLYGAHIDYASKTVGDVHVTSFTADALHSFGKEEKPFEKTAELLFDLFQSPDTDGNGFFKKRIVDAEKQNILSEIKARKNNKQKYAFDKCVDEYTQGSVHGIRSFGKEDIIKDLSPKDLRDGFSSLIEDCGINIFLGGKYSPRETKKICEKVREVFCSNKGNRILLPGKSPAPFIPEDRMSKKSEKMKVEQTKICMIYKTPVKYFSYKSVALNILNLMIGGDVHSLLFQKVREEQGLAYSVYSAASGYLSAVFLLAGVSDDKCDEAVESMDDQIRKIADRDYGDDLLKNSITSAEFSYKSAQDNLHSVIRFYSENMVRGIYMPLSEALNFVRYIKRDDVQEIAGKLSMGASYIIRPVKKNVEKGGCNY